jgi:hypothetical protein
LRIFGRRRFGLLLGDQIVDVPLRPSNHLSALLADAIGATDGGLDQRIERAADLRQKPWYQHRRDTQSDARNQGGFKHKGSDGNDSNRRDRGGSRIDVWSPWSSVGSTCSNSLKS